MTAKRCRQCRQVKPLDQFVRNSDSRLAIVNRDDPRGYRARCSICEITNRTAPKLERRERVKARNSRAYHAKRFGVTVRRLESFHGWDLDRMESDIKVVVAGGCPRWAGGCGEPVTDLADVQLDVIDPDEPPFYGVNTRWVCNTCNQRKGRRSLMRIEIEEAERQAIIANTTQPLPGQLELFGTDQEEP